MKNRLIFVLALFCFAPVFPQGGIPDDVQFVLGRIEQAIQSGNPASIDDLVQSGMTMRLADSLYQSVSSITAMNALNEFFTDKDSIEFRFSLPGSGTMYFSSGGKQDTIRVDVWLRKVSGQLCLQALNISNYPTATVFLDYRKHHLKLPQ